MSFGNRVLHGFDQIYTDIKNKLTPLFAKADHNHNDIYLNESDIVDLIKQHALWTVPDMTRSVRIGVNQLNEGLHSDTYADYIDDPDMFSDPPNGCPYVLEIVRPCFVRVGITTPAKRDNDGDWGVVIADTKERACYYRYIYQSNDAYMLHQMNTALVELNKSEMIDNKNYTIINMWNDDTDTSQTGGGDVWVPLTPGTWVRPGVYGSDSAENWEYWTASIAPCYGEVANTIVAKRHLFAVKSRHNKYINSGLDFGTVSGTNSKIRIYKKDAYDSTTQYVDISQPLNVTC